MSEIDETGSPSSEPSNESWEVRKKALRERLSAGVNAAAVIDRENLAREMKRLAQEVESLEEENHTLSKEATGLQDSLVKKREEAQGLFESSDASKKRLVASLARKRGLLNEIAFFEKEKAQLFKTYMGISQRLQNSVSALDRTLKDLGFFRGEIQALTDKMGMIEGDVPVKYRDMDNLEEKIKRTSDMLKSFKSRMQRMQKTVKETYYISKKD